jgi:hypothetical protein
VPVLPDCPAVAEDWSLLVLGVLLAAPDWSELLLGVLVAAPDWSLELGVVVEVAAPEALGSVVLVELPVVPVVLLAPLVLWSVVAGCE